MKRWYSILLILCLLFTLCACGTNQEDNPDIPDEEDVHVHAFGDWIMMLDSTCVEAGSQMRMCPCGEREIVELLLKEHTAAAWITDKVATPTEKGEAHQVCSSCNSTLQEGDIPVCEEAHTHAYGDWVTSKDATCTEGGQEVRTCSCGLQEVRDTEIIDHRRIDAVIAPTCTEEGYTAHICLACGDMYKDTPVEAIGHNFAIWRTLKTSNCTEEGYQKSSCSNSCGTVEYSVIPFSHIYGEWVELSEKAHGTVRFYEKRVCACGAFEEREHCHEFDVLLEVVPPVCSEDGYSVYACACGDPGRMQADFVKATGKHTYGKWVKVTENVHGSVRTVEKRFCTCGFYEEREHCHEFNVLLETKAPTCSTEGYSVYACACGDPGRLTTTCPPTNDHTFGPWTVTQKPSATENGEECRNCKKCGKIDHREIPATGY